MATFSDLALSIIVQNEKSVLLSIDRRLVDPGPETELLNYLNDYVKSYRCLPTLRETSRSIPDFAYEESEAEPVDFVIRQFFESRRRTNASTELLAMAEQVASGTPIDPARIGSISSMLTLETDKKLFTTNDIEDDMFERDGKGVSLQIDLFDNATQMVQKNELMFIIGPPQSRKTTYATWLSTRLWEKGKNVLLTSFETTAPSLYGSILGSIGQFNPSCLRQFRNMTEDQLRKYRFAVHRLKSASVGQISIPNRHIYSDVQMLDIAKNEGDWDVIIVDGAYMMKTPNNNGAEETGFSWSRLAEVATSLRTIANDGDVPVIAIFHLKPGAKNKKILSLEDIAYSSSLGQITDFAIGMKSLDKTTSEMQLIKNRFGPMGIGLDLQFDYDAFQFSIGEEKDLSSDSEEEDEEFATA